MSAPLASNSGSLETTNKTSLVSTAPSHILNAPESTHLVPLGDTLSNIISIRIPIETALATTPKNAPNKQELTDVVHRSITGCRDLLQGFIQVSATTKARADDLYSLMQDVHKHLQDRDVYGNRAQIKGKVKAFFYRPASPLPMYHLQVQIAFDALKNSLLPSITLHPQINPAHLYSTPAGIETKSENTPTEFGPASPVAPESGPALPVAPERALSHDECLPRAPVEKVKIKQVATAGSKTNAAWGTVADTVQGGLRLLSSLTSFIPDPAGPIVKLIAGTGLTVIEMLEGVADNREEAINLGCYIGTLIQTVGRFLEPPDGEIEASCDGESTKQLQEFLDALKAVEASLAELKVQSRLKEGVSHRTNKDDMKKWEIMISRAFVMLQTQLSLGSIRLLTQMNASDALRERDRLIGLLGDGDIGATQKASNAADLMCLPGTRAAVLDQVDQWIAEPSGKRIFWISGVAGCGKSAVAATIAGRPRAIPTSIAVFYFGRGSQERNKRVICSLSRQLARFGHGSLERYILSNIKASPDIATSHLDIQFQHLIVDPLKKLVPGSPPVILVVDALDEWNNSEAVIKLVELIREAHSELLPTVRFVFACRNEPHLVKALDSEWMKPLVTRYPLDTVLKSDAGLDIMHYIKKRFTKICAHSGIDTKSWPEAGEIDNLVMLSDGLFQWAATVMSYIGEKRSQGRLRDILKNPERYRGLDNLYRGVLDASSGEETDERIPRLLQDVLGAILAAPVPINSTTIAYLCCNDIETLHDTTELIEEEILPSLASMFIIPKDLMQPIKASHKSVLDFLTSENRCTDSRFYTNLPVHHDRILSLCFRLMDSDLKRDICGINDSSKLNNEFGDQIKQHIPSWLRYSCQHWAAHLQGSGHDASTESRRRLGDFSRKHILHWLEVMSLIGLMKETIPIAQDVELWLSACPSLSPADKLTQRLWSDTQRFVAMFSSPISTAAAHIYISALYLIPTETQFARQFAATADRGVRVMGGLLGKEWPPLAWTAKGHTGAVNCASFSPDGKEILSGSSDATLRLWDAVTGAQKGGALEGHSGVVHCASFSPDGGTILSSSDDATVRLWDAESGAQRGDALEGHADPVWCASFSPDGKTILSGSGGTALRLWDVQSGAQKGGVAMSHTGLLRCASFSPDGKAVLSGSRGHTLQIWDAESGARIGDALEGHTDVVWCTSFSPDGKTILSGSGDTTLRLWDAESGTQKGEALEGHTGALRCALFSPDGETILSGSQGGALRLWDAKTGIQKGEALEGHSDVVHCASFSPDGRTVLSASGDKTLRLWDVALGIQKGDTFEGHTGRVWCASFSSDGKTILSGSDDNTLRIWDVDMGVLHAEPRNGHTRGVSCFGFSPDGGMIASGKKLRPVAPVRVSGVLLGI